MKTITNTTRTVTKKEAASLIYVLTSVDISNLETSTLKKLALRVDDLVSARESKSSLFSEEASVEIYKILKVPTFGISTKHLEEISTCLDIYINFER